jgi:hypothetical protein
MRAGKSPITARWSSSAGRDNVVKIDIQQVSLAQAGIQSIEIGKFSVGPVKIGQLKLNNVSLGFSTGQAELTNVSLEIKLQLALVWSVDIPMPWPFGNYTIASTTTDLGSLTLDLPVGNVNIPGMQQITVTMAEAGMANLQANGSPISSLGLGAANATQVVMSSLTLPTGDFQLIGMALSDAQLAGISLPTGNIGSITVGEVKGDALPLSQLVIAGLNLPKTAIANIVSGAMNATATGDTEELDADLGVLTVGLQVTPSVTMSIGQLTLSGLTAGGTIGSAALSGITIPYDIRDLTLTNVNLDTIQVPAVGVA